MITSRALMDVTSISIDTKKGQVVVVTSWAGANAAISQLAPGRETTVTITWSDGHQAVVANPYAPNRMVDVASHVRNTWLEYAGFLKPKHYTDDDYTKNVNSNISLRNAATECLKKYALADEGKTVTVDTKATIAKAISVIPEKGQDWPTVDDITAVLATLVGYRRRVEDPLMGDKHDRDTRDKVRMELRKAIASLTRVEDLL